MSPSLELLYESVVCSGGKIPMKDYYYHRKDSYAAGGLIASVQKRNRSRLQCNGFVLIVGERAPVQGMQAVVRLN
jgi:hypothetical protein